MLLALLMLVFSSAHANGMGLDFDALRDLDPDLYQACVDGDDIDLCKRAMPIEADPDVEPAEEDQGMLDFVEVKDAPGLPPDVHFTHDAYTACLQGDGEECASLYVTRFSLPPEQGEKASEALDEAWRTFNDRMIDTIHEKLNEGEPCATTPSCLLMVVGMTPPPTPRVECIISKLMTAYPAALLEHYPAYWRDVAEAIATHLPNSIAYGLDFDFDPTSEAALQGSIVSPLYEPTDPGALLARLGLPPGLTAITPDMISGMGDDARARLYFEQVPLRKAGIRVPLITFPGEDVARTAGIDAFEELKSTHYTEAAGGLAYQDAGYAYLWQTHAPTTSFFFSRAWRLSDFPTWHKPSVQARCLEGPPIPGYIFPVPIPAHLPQAVSRNIVVPEGGYIPASGGSIDAFPEAFGF